MKELPLILFNERVERLDRCKLAKRMQNPHFRLDWDRMMRREWVSAAGLTEDDVDAFVLNLRLLIQDRDGFSIRCLADRVYSENCVASSLRAKFSQQETTWRQHLERQSVFKHFQEDRKFTNKELFDILLYGGLAHANRDKVRLFYALTKQGAYSSFVFGWFLDSLRVLLEVVREIRAINKELLEHWDTDKGIEPTQ